MELPGYNPYQYAQVLFNGPIPKGHVVRHKCDCNYKDDTGWNVCVNPAHLETGTYADNSNDAVIRNRSSHGTKNGRNKLTEEQVKTIYSDTRSQDKIASEYGVHQTLVSAIKIGKLWSRVTGHIDNSMRARKGKPRFDPDSLFEY
ncbi:hypothetical protein ACF3NX_06315 [Acetobacter orientalis]|uniref:hypothetical protein n=1 Tax=Acetobacter orientalis TaxID=146474 RepID=UPI0038707AFA